MNAEKTAQQILKEIGCITDPGEIKEFDFTHNDFGKSGLYEEYFKIQAENGYVVGTIEKFSDGAVKSHLDYFYGFKFNRNVNFWEELR